GLPDAAVGIDDGSALPVNAVHGEPRVDRFATAHVAIAGDRVVRARNAVQGIDGHSTSDDCAVRSRVRIRFVEGYGSEEIAVVHRTRGILGHSSFDYSGRRAIGRRWVLERHFALDLSLEPGWPDRGLLASQRLAERPVC